MLLRKERRGNEFVSIALEFPPAKPDQDLVILVKDQAVFRAIDPELVHGRAHLGGEREIGRGPLVLADQDSEFINDLRFIDAFEQRAPKAV